MTETAIDHAERIVALEVKVDALTRSVDSLATKVDELLSIVQQARGARWALIGLGAVGGSVLSILTGAAGNIGVIMGIAAK